MSDGGGLVIALATAAEATSAISAAVTNFSVFSQSRSAMAVTAAQRASRVSVICEPGGCARSYSKTSQRLKEQSVKIGGGNDALPLLGPHNVFLFQLGDEAQHPRVLGKADEVFDVSQKLEPVVGFLPCCPSG